MFPSYMKKLEKKLIPPSLLISFYFSVTNKSANAKVRYVCKNFNK